MGKSNKKDKGKKGGGFAKVLVGLVVLLVAGGGAMYMWAPDMLQQGLSVVGIDLRR